jgi:hypothetical protein
VFDLDEYQIATKNQKSHGNEKNDIYYSCFKKTGHNSKPRFFNYLNLPIAIKLL